MLEEKRNLAISKDLERLKEKVEKLTGDRGDAKKPLSAIRRSELNALASIEMLSKQVAGAPTQAEHNALQKDVKTIFEALKRISNTLGNAEIPKV